MSLGQRLRRLFSATSREEEATEREEYGASDRGEITFEEAKGGNFAGYEGVEAADEELTELKRPPDPAP
jgi:hypothetical protein